MNKLFHGDCANILEHIDDNSIDLTVTSPPYNVDFGNTKYKKNG